jgi:hypothetical protein
MGRSIFRPDAGSYRSYEVHAANCLVGSVGNLGGLLRSKLPSRKPSPNGADEGDDNCLAALDLSCHTRESSDGQEGDDSETYHRFLVTVFNLSKFSPSVCVSAFGHNRLARKLLTQRNVDGKRFLR